MQDTATKKYLIHVVDSDDAISRLVSINLIARGYLVKQFSHGFGALASRFLEYPDLIILDPMMPDCDGLEIAKTIRQTSQVPILVLSVEADTELLDQIPPGG